MNTEVFSIIVQAVVSVFSILGGVFMSQKVVNVKLDVLEKKVEKHNNTIERTYALEQGFKDMKEDIKEIKDKLK